MQSFDDSVTQGTGTQRANPGFGELLRNSQLLRVLLIGFLVLLLQIPTAMVQGLVSDRQTVRQEAIAGIVQTVGASQSILGPRLAIPYARRVKVGNAEQTRAQTAVFLPDKLKITGDLKTDTKYRGIFKVPVYTANLQLEGSFDRPDFSQWNVRPEDIQWNGAELSLQISDAKAIQSAKLNWNQATLDFAPGAGKLTSNRSGIHTVLRDQMQPQTFLFKIPLTLRGSEKFSVAPFGNETEVQLTSDWKDPSFQGSWSPESEVNQEGFTATWKLTSLGRNYADRWTSETAVDENSINQSLFGVELISPVDNYRMADRSVKYNALFILLTFVTFWLFELTTRLRVHPLQYLLVGGAMSLFYLLQLALSEHMGFHLAYAIASGAVVLLITAYSFGILGAKRRGGVIGVVETALYSYLYVVLANQDYSLLIGSLGLFVFLAIAMFFTRRLNANSSAA